MHSILDSEVNLIESAEIDRASDVIVNTLTLNIPMLRQLLRFLALFFSVSLLGFTLALVWEFPLLSQSLPMFGVSEDEISIESYVPVFTRGNLDIAPIFVDGKMIAAVSSFIELESDEEEHSESSYGADSRAYLIHRKLQKILDNMNRYSRLVLRQQEIIELDAQQRELRKQLITNVFEDKGTVSMSITFPKDDVPEVIYTVTKADISRPRFGQSQPLIIATEAANIGKTALIEGWRERQLPHLRKQGQHALLILIGLLGMSLSFNWGEKRIITNQEKLKKRLSKPNNFTTQESQIFGRSQPLDEGTKKLSSSQKLSLKLRISLNAFYKAVLLWTKWLIWLLGIGYLTSLFYWTRPLSNWIIGVTVRGIRGEIIVQGWPPLDWLLSFGQEATLGTPLLILLLLFITRLTLKGGDVLSDFLAQQWTKQQSVQRHHLRAPTLARILKAWLRVIVYLLLGLAIAYLVQQLGQITQTVAVLLGLFSLAFSLASQNLLKDLIAGALILWEDQYAVGDVVIINEQGGLVENISLRVTKLRNLEGELITIPNGSIGMVRNLSSEWSRVNYAIKVNYDADIKHVIKVMESVAQHLYQDPQWQNRILEAPEILGIDEISHTGILIRLIIKTQPLEQWSVAREFRLRLKEAFDEQGIEVGIPRQVDIHVNQSFSTINNGEYDH